MEALFVVWYRSGRKGTEKRNKIHFTRLYHWVQTTTYSTQAPSCHVHIRSGWCYVFFIKSLKYPNSNFNILNYVQFTSGSTRSAGYKLKHMSAPTNSVINSYFFCLPKLWNSLPIIDLSESIALINFKLKNYFWEHFINNFDHVVIIFVATYHILCPCFSYRCSYHNTSFYKLFFSLNLYPFIPHYLFYKYQVINLIRY